VDDLRRRVLAALSRCLMAPSRLRTKHRSGANKHWKWGGQCPLWVIGGHLQCKTPCPLLPRKRTCPVHYLMSVKCQKRTCGCAFGRRWDLFRIGGVKTVDEPASLKFVDER